MLDIKFVRENPEAVKENIRKKFQDEKLPLVDEVIAKDAEARKAQTEADNIRAQKNTISKQIGALMKEGKKEEAQALKDQVAANAKRLEELNRIQEEAQEIVHKDMMVIPQMVSDKVEVWRSCRAGF